MLYAFWPKAHNEEPVAAATVSALPWFHAGESSTAYGHVACYRQLTVDFTSLAGGVFFSFCGRSLCACCGNLLLFGCNQHRDAAYSQGSCALGTLE